MRAFPDKGTVIVDGVNTVKKSQRAVRATMQAGIIDKDMPVPASKVALICPHCNRPTRIGFRFDAGAKVRICRKCGGEV
jgi:large subunit ribosomal protein L24